MWTRLRRGSASIARWTLHGDTLIVWCDGTQSLRQWRWNFMPRRVAVGDGFVRVNVVDYEQAFAVLRELVYSDALDGASSIVTAGYSRGGAVAWILAWLVHDSWSVSTRSWAGKRAGNRALRRAVPQEGEAWRGDIVPLLPPFYASAWMIWFRPWRWPWDAHLRAAHAAARWRHELS